MAVLVYLLSVNGNGWLEAAFISEQLFFKIKLIIAMNENMAFD